MQNSKAEPTEPADIANDRSSRFVWQQGDLIIIKAGDETPAADAKHQKPAPAADAPPAPSKNDIDNDDQDKKAKP